MRKVPIVDVSALAKIAASDLRLLWVNDWYDAHYYEKSPAKNPIGPDTGTKKIIRGAGWQNETPTVRIFTRVESDPKIRNESTGFRCAMNAVK